MLEFGVAGSGFTVGFCGVRLGTAHTGAVYNRATIKGLIYPHYECYSTVAACGQYPRFRACGLGIRVQG